LTEYREYGRISVKDRRIDRLGWMISQRLGIRSDRLADLPDEPASDYAQLMMAGRDRKILTQIKRERMSECN